MQKLDGHENRTVYCVESSAKILCELFGDFGNVASRKDVLVVLHCLNLVWICPL